MHRIHCFLLRASLRHHRVANSLCYVFFLMKSRDSIEDKNQKRENERNISITKKKQTFFMGDFMALPEHKYIE